MAFSKVQYKPYIVGTTNLEKAFLQTNWFRYKPKPRKPNMFWQNALLCQVEEQFPRWKKAIALPAVGLDVATIEKNDKEASINDMFAEALNSPAAAAAVNAYTREKLSEQSFLRRLLPPLPISDEEL